MSNRETENYQENLELILAVTKTLNSDIFPESKDYYVRVELIEAGTHRRAGSWNDEIANDCWSFAWDWEDQNK